MNNSVKERSTNDKFSAKASFLGALAYAVLLAYIPIALFSNIEIMALEALSIAVIALCAFTIFKLAGNPRPILTFLTPFAIFFFFGGSFVLLALFAATLGAVPLFACLLYKANSAAARVFAFFMTFAVYLASSFVIGRFGAAALCLAFIPAAVILAVCLYKKSSRVLTICGVSAGLLLPPAILICVWLFAVHGGDVTVIVSVVDAAREALAKQLAWAIAQVMIETEFTLSLSSAVVSLLFNSLPAIVITVSNLLAFAFQSLAASVLTSPDDDRETVISLYQFKMSTASAAVFFIFLILSAVFSYEASNMLAMAATNVVVILTPGLVYTAMLTIKRLTLTKTPSCFGFLIYLGAIMLLIRIPEYAIIGGAMAGASAIIIDTAKRAIARSKL